MPWAIIILFLSATVSGKEVSFSERSNERQEIVNKFYFDEISHKDSAPTRIERTRNVYKENPRNSGFAASFGSVYSNTIKEKN